MIDMLTSIIFLLPVYNEENVLEKSVVSLSEFLKDKFQNYFIVIANNGSIDKTGEVAKKLEQKDNKIVLLGVNKKGRGAAIKEVVKNFKAEIYAYMDIDLPINLEDLPRILDLIREDKANLVVIKRSGDRPLARRFLTKSMRLLNRLILGIDFSDPQSGVKAFDMNVSKLVLKCVEDTYFLDTEIIKSAKFNNYKVYEHETEWIDSRYKERKTKVNLIKDSREALKALIRIDRLFDKNVRELTKLALVFLPFIVLIALLGVEFSLRGAFFGPTFEMPEYTAMILLLCFSVFGVFFNYVISKSKYRFDKMARLVFGVFLISLILFSITKPLFSQDIYWNMLLAKGFVFDRMNPYLTPPYQLGHYQLYNYLHMWEKIPMTHGPVSVYYYILPYLITNSDKPAIILLRLFSGLVVLATAFVLFKIVKDGSDYSKKKFVPLIFLTAPLVLVNGILDAHNDILVMFSITLSYYFLLKEKDTLSFVSLILGFAVKYITVVLLPIPLIRLLLSRKSVKTKIQEVALMVLISAAIVVISYAPFLKDGWNVPPGLKFQAMFSHYTVMAFPTYLIQVLTRVNPIHLKLFGFFAGAGVAGMLSLKGKYLEAYVIPVLLILFTTTTWLVSWYFLWIFPLLLLFRERSHIVVSLYILFLGTFGFSINSLSSLVLIYMYIVIFLRMVKKWKRPSILTR